MGLEASSWSDRLTLPPLPASVAVARGFVEDLLVEHELSYLVGDLRLVVSELASNAIRHARTPFTVKLDCLPDSVRLTVTDGSSLRLIRPDMQATATAVRGLNVLGSCCRDWGVRHNGAKTKSVWASFALQSRERADTPYSPGVRRQTPPASLAILLRDVKTQRAGLRAARSCRGAAAVRQAQDRLAAALKLYVDALDSRHLPVPYLLRDELRLYARTTAAHNTSRVARG